MAIFYAYALLLPLCLIAALSVTTGTSGRGLNPEQQFIYKNWFQI
jgi:hypothetical protein